MRGTSKANRIKLRANRDSLGWELTGTVSYQKVSLQYSPQRKGILLQTQRI